MARPAERREPFDTGDVAAAAAPDLAGSIAYVGTPQAPDQRDRWLREITLLDEAGLAPLALPSQRLEASRPGSITLEAGLVMLADPIAAKALSMPNPAVQIGLRFHDSVDERAWREIAARWDRRLVVIAESEQERARLSARLGEARVHRSVWAPVLDPGALHGHLARPVPQPLRVAFEPMGGGAAFVPWIADALRQAKRGGDRVRIVEAPAGCVKPADYQGIDLLIGPPEAGNASFVFRAITAFEGGALPALSDAWKPELGGAGLFWNYARLPEKVLELLDEPALWRRQFLALSRSALERFGAERWLERLRAGLFTPSQRLRSGRGRVIDETALAGHVEADLAVIGDFTRRGESLEQAIVEMRERARAGQTVVLCPVCKPRQRPLLHRGIEMLVRDGLARPAAPWQPIRCGTARVILPRVSVPALDFVRPEIDARQIEVVELKRGELAYEPARLHATLARLYKAPVTWQAADDSVARTLAAVVPTDPRPLRPLATAGWRSPSMGRFVIGLVAYTPEDGRAMLDWLAATAASARIDRRLLLAGTRRTLDIQGLASTDVLTIEGVDLAGFCAKLDVLVVGVPREPENLPLQAVTQALQSGLEVVADPALAPALGEGPTYLPPERWADALRGRARSTRRKPAARLDLAAPLADRLAQRLAASSRPCRSARAAPAAPGPRRVLFATANGVGLGHITRLAAIARRLPETCEAVFATMSQAVGILEPMGFQAELLTTYNGKEGRSWDAATARRLDQILDYHAPDVLVLDTSNPYPGVVRAAAARPGLKLAWVRRGMWRATQNNAEFLSRAPYFDLVIEPDDISGERDETSAGLAAGGRIKVPPIGLLDERELLDRHAARAALGLDPEHEGASVLVQLGSGTTRDLNRLLQRVFETLARIPGLEIVLAQWLNAPAENQALWPGVKILRGYPIPRYYRAFDFTISAAGYNSFNDLLRFGVPTIFIANDAPVMDDQGARGRYAQDAEAAFDIHEFELDPLEDCVRAILQPEVRRFLADNARRIAKPNGARRAASAIASLIDAS